MQTTITADNGIKYSMSLTRDVENHVYVLTFASQHRFIQNTEVHRFEDFTTAWEHYANNMHYYRGFRPEPLTEEQFLGIPTGTLYKEAAYA